MEVIAIIISALCLVLLFVLVFRKKYKDKPIRFKIPGGAFVPVFAVIVSLWLLVEAGISDPMKIVWGLGGLLIAVPFYFYMTKVYKAKEVE